MWRKTPFPIYDEMHALVDSVVATGSGAFQAGATPGLKTLQIASQTEHPTEDSGPENSQSTGSTALCTPSRQDMVGCPSL